MSKQKSTTVRSEHEWLGGGHKPGGLTAEEERWLVQIVRASLVHGPSVPPDGTAARGAEATLVAEHLHLVPSLARRIGRQPGTDIGDLEGAGFEALVLAVRSFDPTRGPRLSCYTAICIGRAMYSARASKPMTVTQVGHIAEVGTRSTTDSFVTVSLEELRDFADPAVAVEDQALARVEALQVHDTLSKIDANDRWLLVRRHGLAGDDPVSQVALAAELSTSRKALRCREEAARRHLRCAYARLGGDSQ